MKKPEPAETLPWTGERLVATCRRPMAYEHLHRYSITCGLAKGKRVLDIACGEGYGANLLAQVGADVTGVDSDKATLTHAKRKYRRRNFACSKSQYSNSNSSLLERARAITAERFCPRDHIDGLGIKIASYPGLLRGAPDATQTKFIIPNHARRRDQAH